MSTEDLRSRWRPVFAFTFTACFAAIVAVVAIILVATILGLSGAAAAARHLVEFWPLLGLLFTGGFAVLGVQAHGRSLEKRAGRASPETAGPFAAGERGTG